MHTHHILSNTRVRHMALALALPSLLVLLLLPVSAPAGIPADHAVYGFLQRAWLYGATGQPPPTVRPETLPNLLDRLADVDSHRERLPVDERAILDDLLSDLAVYLPDRAPLPETTRWAEHTRFGDKLFAFGSHFYGLRKDEISFSFDPIVSYDGIYDESYNDEPLFRSMVGFEVRAALGEDWTAGVRFTDTGEYNLNEAGDRYTQPGGYRGATAVEDAGSFDEVLTWLEYHHEYVDVGIGRDRLERGPLLDEGLLLSGKAPSYLYLQLRARITPYLVFDIFHARLDPSPVPEDTVYRSPSGKLRKVDNLKWLAGHRIEWTPTWWLGIGLSETVIYAERDVEVGYLIPLNFFWSENHYQDRDDNIAWGIDLRVQPVSGLVLYAEYLMDETSISGMFSDKLHNRTGYLLGLDAVDPLGLRSSLLEVHFSRLRPYVYSHWFDVSVYTHDAASLGSPEPPNSEVIRARLSKRFGATWQAGVLVERQRHGVRGAGGDPVGGNLFDLVPVGRRDRSYPMLAGDVTTTWRMEANARWQPLERLSLGARIGAIRRGNETFSLFLSSFTYNL